MQAQVFLAALSACICLLRAWQKQPTESCGHEGSARPLFAHPLQLSLTLAASAAGRCLDAGFAYELFPSSHSSFPPSPGFLEPQAGGSGAVAIPAQQPAADKGLARNSVQSSLTAALTTIGEA